METVCVSSQAHQSTKETTMIMLLSLMFLNLPVSCGGRLHKAMADYVFKNSPKQWFTYVKKYISLSLNEIENIKPNSTIIDFQVNVS